MAETCNIADALRRMALTQPDAVALRVPRGRAPAGQLPVYLERSYSALDADSDHTAAALAYAGIGAGMKTALMVRPGVDLFVLMFALFKLGAVPVLIDPGISRRALKQCLDEAAPQAFVGIGLAHCARVLLGWARRSVRISVSVGSRLAWGGHRLCRLRERVATGTFSAPATRSDALAAILFTSGSTGVPKGVEYRHRHFVAQVDLLGAAFAIEPGMVNMPTFPPFALFDPALGSTSVIPDMDPTRPASADPARLTATIARFGVNMLFGSPALLNTLSRHCVARGEVMQGVRIAISAGAPMSPRVLDQVRRSLPAEARIYTPYGATECLPVAVIESRELLGAAMRRRTEAGAGTCVGRVLAANTVRIIRIDDAPFSEWSDDLLAPPDRVGEITVAGPTVTDAYHGRPQATALAKIREGERVVHRMGDLGYFDKDGLLWFCGRKSQRVRSASGELYTEQVEPIFNAIAGVHRTALVGLPPGADGLQQPVLCVQLDAGQAAPSQSRVEAEIHALADQHAHTRCIQHVLFHADFPVDIRHNAKIGREKLALWAARRLNR